MSNEILIRDLNRMLCAPSTRKEAARVIAALEQQILMDTECIERIRSIQHDIFNQISQMRLDWLAENDPKDGTDCVTPFDHFLYGGDLV